MQSNPDPLTQEPKKQETNYIIIPDSKDGEASAQQRNCKLWIDIDSFRLYDTDREDLQSKD